ncbi:hypothetical protein PUN28_014291 [Cardiocondyla obscurior]|uniref:Uncharacterized protein n=1 Tax=Cardiocondyla obscurior TaxID=286306 RepID=A0AAW2F596_9HYME
MNRSVLQRTLLLSIHSTRQIKVMFESMRSAPRQSSSSQMGFSIRLERLIFEELEEDEVRRERSTSRPVSFAV